MDIRIKCPCGARLVVSDDLRGSVVECSECGRKTRVPRKPDPVAFVTEDASELPAAPPPQAKPVLQTARVAAAGRVARPAVAPEVAPTPHEPDEPDTAWHSRKVVRSADDSPRGGAWKWLLLALVLLVPVGVVGVLIALPYFQNRDPREVVAEKYLNAVRRDDWDTANKLSVLKTHPRLTGVDRIGQVERGTRETNGKFQGLAAFHARIHDEYTYNPDIARFTPKNTLGPGLGALSQLEQAKKKAEQQIEANKADPGRSRKSPEEQMLDDAIASYGAIGDLAKGLDGLGGILSSQKLGPTYDDLLKQTDVTLSDAERSLAAHYARDPAKWDRLLGRSFLDLPDGGDFSLQEVEIVATIRTEGQSYGEPGRPITLRLVRFEMGSIGTGWRVWQAE